MIRVGIVGTQSIHASKFTELIKISNVAEVTQIVETDEYETLESIDALIVTERDGNRHMQIALHFIDKKIPIWIDKPFTCNSKEAEIIIDRAAKNNVFVMGGSTIKFVPEVLELRKTKDITAATITWLSSLNSEYNGLHFYGSHLVETALEIFGRDCEIKSVTRRDEDVIACLQYEKFILKLCFVKDNYDLFVDIKTKDNEIAKVINIGSCYKDGMNYFLKVLTGEINPEPPENLIQNVKIMEDIICTLNNG